MWISFNDNQTKDGVEGRYRIVGKVLQVVCYGSNSPRDWWRNLHPLTWFLGYNPNYMDGAVWLSRFVRLVMEKHGAHRAILYGHSKAAAECLLAKELLTDKRIEVKTYGGVKAGFSPPEAMHYINRGDWVALWPPFFVRRGETARLGKWRPVWRAHDPKNYDIPR